MARPKKVVEKEQGTTDRDGRRAALLEFIGKKMKDRAVIKPASEFQLPYLTKRLPTGLLSIDLALKGGFPAGGISQIKGPKNSGKSWLGWQVVRQLQYYLGENMKVLLAMTEMRADRSQARLAGVKISLGDDDIDALEDARVKNGHPKFTKEQTEDLKTQVGIIDEIHGESAESLYDGILRAIEYNAYHLIILDSIGAVLTAAEAENESLQQKSYGGSAKVNTEFLRKMTSLMLMDDATGNVRDTCIIAVNQVRDAIGDPTKEFRSPGGRALEHALFVDLFVASGSKIGVEAPVLTAAGTKKQFIQTGKEVNWRIEKGKAGIHEGAKSRYVYDFDSGTVDFYLDTVVEAIKAGIIEQAGTWLTFPNPEDPKTPLIRTQGKDKFVQALQEDAFQRAQAGDYENSYMNILRSMCFKKADINVVYDWE